MFKKILSILLVLCMVCAFLPASIASAAEQENKDVKIVYSLGTSNVATNTKLNTVTDYSQTGGSLYAGCSFKSVHGARCNLRHTS